MFLKFASGAIYEYAGVPKQIHTGLLNTDSPGHYFHQEIKTRYPFRQVESIPKNKAQLISGEVKLEISVANDTIDITFPDGRVHSIQREPDQNQTVPYWLQVGYRGGKKLLLAIQDYVKSTGVDSGEVAWDGNILRILGSEDEPVETARRPTEEELRREARISLAKQRFGVI